MAQHGEIQEQSQLQTLEAPKSSQEVTVGNFEASVSSWSLPSAIPSQDPQQVYFAYEEVGRGQSLVVLRARLRRTIEYIAVKWTPKKHRSLIQNEILVLSHLEHPHIVEFVGWLETESQIHAIQEFCRGGDLLRLVKENGGFPESTISQFGRDIADGLHYIHSRGLIHGDLTPSNLLINEYGMVKFADFKLAIPIPQTNLQDLPWKQIHRGSPRYMAPELADALPIPSFASDIWSFGCVLMTLHTGSTPFQTRVASSSGKSSAVAPFRPAPSHPFPGTFSSSAVLSAPTDSKCSEMSESFRQFAEACFRSDPAKRIPWTELLKTPFFAGLDPIQLRELPEQPLFDQRYRKAASEDLVDPGLEIQRSTAEPLHQQSTAIQKIPPQSSSKHRSSSNPSTSKKSSSGASPKTRWRGPARWTEFRKQLRESMLRSSIRPIADSVWISKLVQAYTFEPRQQASSDALRTGTGFCICGKLSQRTRVSLLALDCDCASAGSVWRHAWLSQFPFQTLSAHKISVLCSTAGEALQSMTAADLEHFWDWAQPESRHAHPEPPSLAYLRSRMDPSRLAALDTVLRELYTIFLTLQQTILDPLEEVLQIQDPSLPSPSIGSAAISVLLYLQQFSNHPGGSANIILGCGIGRILCGILQRLIRFHWSTPVSGGGGDGDGDMETECRCSAGSDDSLAQGCECLCSSCRPSPPERIRINRHPFFYTDPEAAFIGEHAVLSLVVRTLGLLFRYSTNSPGGREILEIHFLERTQASLEARPVAHGTLQLLLKLLRRASLELQERGGSDGSGRGGGSEEVSLIGLALHTCTTAAELLVFLASQVEMQQRQRRETLSSLLLTPCQWLRILEFLYTCNQTAFPGTWILPQIVFLQSLCNVASLCSRFTLRSPVSEPLTAHLLQDIIVQWDDFLKQGLPRLGLVGLDRDALDPGEQAEREQEQLFLLSPSFLVSLARHALLALWILDPGLCLSDSTPSAFVFILRQDVIHALQFHATTSVFHRSIQQQQSGSHGASQSHEDSTTMEFPQYPREILCDASILGVAMALYRRLLTTEKPLSIRTDSSRGLQLRGVQYRLELSPDLVRFLPPRIGADR